MHCKISGSFFPVYTVKKNKILFTFSSFQPEFTAFSPSSLLFLVDHPDFDKFNLKSLKLIFVGGSLLGSNLLDKIKVFSVCIVISS